jgi:predicted metal-binding membrane protein
MTGSAGRPNGQSARLARANRGSVWAFAALVVIAGLAWSAVLMQRFGGNGSMSPMDTAPGHAFDPLAGAEFVGAWLVMMAAMMLPSTTPMVLLYRNLTVGSQRRRAVQLVVFVSAYLITWALFGAAVFVAQEVLGVLTGSSPDLRGAWPRVVAAVVLGAGVYQLSPLKDICLRQCRSPFSFLMGRWRPGVLGGLTLGFRHGVYCVGCCWGLMAILIAAGAMGLAWMALIAAVVFAEKLLPPGRHVARVVGVALIGVAIVVALRPELIETVRM